MTEERYGAPRGIFYEKFREKRWNEKFNTIVSRPTYLLPVVAILCAIGYLFSLEIVCYTLYVLIMSAIALFAKNVGYSVLFYPFMYIMPSAENNPATNASSFLYPKNGLIYLGVLAIIYLPLVITAIVKDRKNLQKRRPALWWSFLILGVAYLLSGAFTEYFTFKNFIFSFAQIGALCLFYFMALYLVDWQEVGKETFAWLLFYLSAVLLVEIVGIYFQNDLFALGRLQRKAIHTGWGQHNNLGNATCVTLAGIFYLMSRGKRKILYFLYACLVFVGIMMTTSRGSMLFGGLVFLICCVLAIRKMENKKSRRMLIWVPLAILSCAIVTCVILYFSSGVFQNTVKKVMEKGGFFSDMERYTAWGRGLKQFAEYPLFGAGFFECTAYQFGTVTMSFIPARWHNVFVQLLASCGVVGLLAYLVHRVHTIRFFLKNKSFELLYIALCIAPILLGGLVDNHLFNFGPALTYGLLLGFAEGSIWAKNSVEKEEEIPLQEEKLQE